MHIYAFEVEVHAARVEPETQVASIIGRQWLLRSELY